MFGPAAWARPTPSAATAASATTATRAAVPAKRGFMVLAPSPEDPMRADTAGRRRAVLARRRRPRVAAASLRVARLEAGGLQRRPHPGRRERNLPHADARRVEERVRDRPRRRPRRRLARRARRVARLVV